VIAARECARSPPVTLPDEQLARAKAELDAQGFCRVQGVLPEATIAELRDAVVRVAAAEIADDTDYVYENGANQRIWVLLNKGRLFEELVQHETALELVGHLLGPGFLLSNLNANIAGPGGKPMFLHSDQDYVPAPFPPYALVANIVWCLDEFTADNGATRIVPGSHKLLHPPDYTTTYGTVPLVAPRGTMIVIHGALWHQTGANVTADRKRHAILAYYCRPFMRQQENFFKSLRDEVLARATPRLRQLLGYEMWYGGVGAIGGLPRDAPRF
jgi:ectoine hydroxylase-related dioxygenase (phytanoyl-CoA dioxygenase family)